MNYRLHLIVLLACGLFACGFSACSSSVPPDDDDDTNDDDDDSGIGDDDDSGDPGTPPLTVLRPEGSVPCADPIEDYSFSWTLRWGGDEYPSNNLLYEGWVVDGGSFIASFSGIVDILGDDPDGGEGRYIEILETPPSNSPPAPDPDRLRIHYTLPEGLTVPLTIGQPLQAELNISRDGLVVRTGVALWATLPQIRELIVLFEGTPGGVALPAGEGHLFSEIKVGESDCPETPALSCIGARPAPVYITPNEGVYLFPNDPNIWEVWPGTTLIFPGERGEFTFGLSWSWLYSDSNCPNAGVEPDVGFFIVNHMYHHQ